MEILVEKMPRYRNITFSHSYSEREGLFWMLQPSVLQYI